MTQGKPLNKTPGRMAYEAHADRNNWQDGQGNSLTAWGCLSQGEQRDWERMALDRQMQAVTVRPIEKRERRG